MVLGGLALAACSRQDTAAVASGVAEAMFVGSCVAAFGLGALVCAVGHLLLALRARRGSPAAGFRALAVAWWALSAAGAAGGAWLASQPRGAQRLFPGLLAPALTALFGALAWWTSGQLRRHDRGQSPARPAGVNLVAAAGLLAAIFATLAGQC